MLLSFQDRQLVSRCLENKRKAQKELFEKYYKAMFSIAFGIVGNEDDAYDVVQETFINVFNHLHQFRFQSTLGAWIKKILIREALRKTKPDIRDIEQPANPLEPITWPDDLSGDYLQKAILDLPAGFRVVFTLIEIEGYSHKEVAEIMNISEGTSKSQLYYAKRTLQKKLNANKL